MRLISLVLTVLMHFSVLGQTMNLSDSLNASERLKRIAELDSLITGYTRAEISKKTVYSDLKNQQPLQNITKSSTYTTIAEKDSSEFNNSSNFFKKKEYLQDKTIGDLVKELIDVAQIENTDIPIDTIEKYIDNIRFYETIFQLHEKFRKDIKNEVRFKTSNRDIFIKRLKENLDLINYQYEFLLNEEYTLFKNTNISNQLIKGINIYHDNDFLFLPPLTSLNHDRDYTGGIRIEITTDQLKMRLLAEIFEDSKFLNNSNVLTYQSLFFGVEAYTPYIRFGKEEAALRDSVYNIDRPFASFQYFGRSRYRLHYTGKWRFRNDTKIGWIGKSLAKVGQDVLHRDVNIASVHVEKWEDQIGNGGRLAINFDYFADFMLHSVDGDIFKPNRQYKKPYSEFKHRSFHLYAPMEAHFGNQYSGLAAGLGLSNLSFKDRSGGYDFNLPKSRRIDKNGQFGKWLQKSICLSWETRLKYVIHNSMLQGIGWFSTKENDNDGISDEFESKRKLIPYKFQNGDTPDDNFNLKQGEINKWVMNMDFSVALKQKKTTIFLTYSFNTKEYRYNSTYIDNVVRFANSKSTIPNKENMTWNEIRSDNISQKKYAQNIIDKELFTQKIRGYGRVGLNFQL